MKMLRKVVFNNMVGLTRVVSLLVVSLWTFTYGDQFCRPLQYVEYKSKGTLICTFETEFLSLFWYDYHDATTVNPVLIFDEYGKSGSGYESGEYDLYSNGSLIINEVSMDHERNFTVVVRYSKTVKSSTIGVVVTVPPEQLYPVIVNCNSQQNCFITMAEQENIVCLVREAKPATNLEWYSGSLHQENIIPSLVTISKGVVGYITKAIATYQLPQSYTLKLLICKASAIPPLLINEESQMLVEFNGNSFSLQETSDVYVKLLSNYTMKCTQRNSLYIVWKQRLPNSEFENVAYSTFVTDVVSQLYSTHFHLEKDGSLTVLEMSDRHETLFCCVSGKGEYQDVTSYALKLYDLPVPPFPVIDGCQSHLGCRIVADVEGNLTCTVKGVLPKVDLNWAVIGGGEVQNTFFKSHHREAKEIGNKFDVTVTSRYQLKQSGLQKITLECRCNGSEIEALMLVATVELYFPVETSVSTLLIGIIIASAIVIIIFVIAISLVWRRRTEDKGHKVETAHPPGYESKGNIERDTTNKVIQDTTNQSSSPQDTDNENQPNSNVETDPLLQEHGKDKNEGNTINKVIQDTTNQSSSSKNTDNENQPNSNVEIDPLLKEHGKDKTEKDTTNKVIQDTTNQSSSPQDTDNENQPKIEVEGTPISTKESSTCLKGKASEKSDKLSIDMQADQRHTELVELFKHIQNELIDVELKKVEMKGKLIEVPMKVHKKETEICFDIPGCYDLNEKTVGSLIRPSLLIDSVKEISFHHCYMPYEFTSEDWLQSAFRDKVTVKWVPRFQTVEDSLKETTNPVNLYVLNTNGQWEEMEPQKTLDELLYKTKRQGWKSFEEKRATEVKDST